MAIYTTPIDRQADFNFKAGAGYKLYFYDAGTTNARDTYTDNTYTTPLANPVVADGSGYFSVIWTSGNYKVRLTDASDVLIWEVDNYSTDSGSAVFAESIQSAAGSAADVITANLSTTPSELTSTLQVVVELAHGANTIGNPTFNLNSLGAVKIVRDDNKPLRAGDTGGSGYKIYLAYSTTLVAWVLLNPALPSRGLGDEFISGLKTTNGTDATHDVDTTAGYISDSTGSVVMESSSTYTKQIDAVWAEGSASGGLPSGVTIPTNGWIKYFMIMKSDGTTDFGWDTDSGAANLLTASSYTYYAWIDEHYSTDGATIEPWVLNGRTRIWATPVLDSTTTNNTELTIQVRVPANRESITLYTVSSNVSGASQARGKIAQTDQPTITTIGSTSLAVRGDGTNEAFNSAVFNLRVNSSSQIKHREDANMDAIAITTLGWKE